MQRKCILLTIVCAVTTLVAAQKVVSVSGEFTYYAPSTMSLDEAKQEALLQTRLHVLAARFGTVVSSTTNIFIDNREGQQTSSNTQVQTLAINEVRGEWIEDTREPQQEVLYERTMPNTTIIKTRVWGRAREITSAKAELDIHLLKDTIIGSDADVFKHEQPFYLSLQSPVAGYIAVYLLDPDAETAYCLLPTANDQQGSIRIESNRLYVFFRDDTEYIFTAERSVVFNQIVVVFSPNEFFKAKDQQQTSENYTLPRETSISLFNQWLARCKTHDTQLQSATLTAKIVR